MERQGERQGILAETTNERAILQRYIDKNTELNTDISKINSGTTFKNPVGEDLLGKFREPDSRRYASADPALLNDFLSKGLAIPSFLEAGPRIELSYDPHKVRAAIATTGGVAPGLNSVIHSIVKRHCDIYGRLNGTAGGKIYGVLNSFRGLCNLADNISELEPAITENWIDQGGSKLGNIRDTKSPDTLITTAEKVSNQLKLERIDILYIIGGDGSMAMAHEIAKVVPQCSVVGIPKTMDNDILWVWKAFGFDTTVERATHVINTLKAEAEAVRRIALIELFGAESGFVAANASLASGHVDAVLVPELFETLSKEQAEGYIEEIISHIERTIRTRDEPRLRSPHAVVVIAEGVSKWLAKKQSVLAGYKVDNENFVQLLQKRIENSGKGLRDGHGNGIKAFVNQPRHYIRSFPANPYDQISCERLGALAVDSALAGYTDCLISQWLTEFVLVPLELLIKEKKGIDLCGIFWKQVVNTTGQPVP